MAKSQLLELQEVDGKWEYIPDPDESEVKESIFFLSGIDLALQLRHQDPARYVRAEDISLHTIIQILPEWLKDTIYAVSVLAELLTTRFMVDGKWVKFSKWKIGWNFMSLIMIYKAAKNIVKTFKKPSE